MSGRPQEAATPGQAAYEAWHAYFAQPGDGLTVEGAWEAVADAVLDGDGGVASMFSRANTALKAENGRLREEAAGLRIERDRCRQALERVLRILRGEGTEAMDDEELAAVIDEALEGGQP